MRDKKDTSRISNSYKWSQTWKQKKEKAMGDRIKNIRGGGGGGIVPEGVWVFLLSGYQNYDESEPNLSIP